MKARACNHCLVWHVGDYPGYARIRCAHCPFTAHSWHELDPGWLEAAARRSQRNHTTNCFR